VLLAEALDLDVENLDDLTIECFDISHTAGELRRRPAWSSITTSYKVASTAASRSSITGGDDYAAMRQVLKRRYSKVAEAQREAGGAEVSSNLARLPDLVLVDGGKGQVAWRARCSPNWVWILRIVGVEKGEGARSDWRLVFADGRAKVYLGRDSAALMLVAQIRDEAHRFAITGMRAARAKVRMSGSRLEDIPGVGPRSARLLQRLVAYAAWPMPALKT
jgi:excinuclease ABC subunit C